MKTIKLKILFLMIFINACSNDSTFDDINYLNSRHILTVRISDLSQKISKDIIISDRNTIDNLCTFAKNSKKIGFDDVNLKQQKYFYTIKFYSKPEDSRHMVELEIMHTIRNEGIIHPHNISYLIKNDTLARYVSHIFKRK